MNIRKQNMNDSPRRRRLFARTATLLLALLLAADLTHHAPYLQAQPTDFNFQRTPNVRRDLRRYFDEADKKKEAADWQRIIESGRRLAAAEWELNADREIEQRLKDAPADQKESLRLQYESEKEVARFAWELEVDRGIDERRGQWRARLASEPLLPLLDEIKIDDIRAAVAAADALVFAATDTIDTRIAAFDAATAAVTTLRAEWEARLAAGTTTLRDSGAGLTGDERTAFLAEVARIEQEYRDLYRYDEYQELGRGRQKFIRRENRAADLNRTIADETDPAKLAQLLIERVSRNVDPITGELLRDDGSGGTLVVGYDSGGSDTETRIAAALENGRKQWQAAIDELILKKLKFDRETAEKRSEGTQEWARAYQEVLDARSSWLDTINKQIQAGLSQWDAGQADLAENKRKALAQLEKFTETSRAAYTEHARGLEQMVLGGSDTLGTIVENIRWFQEALQRPDVAGNAAVRNTYQTQLTYWQGLEARYRNVVVAAQNVVHNQDMQGAGGGVGLLNPAGPNNVLTEAEFDLKIANKEKELLEQRLERAQAVYDYALSNAKQTPAEIGTQLDAAKLAHTNAEQCYLKRLTELNGGDASAYACAAPGGGGSELSKALDDASSELEKKRTALELARKNLDESRKRYDEILKLQVLSQNPDIIKYIGGQTIPVYEDGKPKLDKDGNPVRVSSLRDEVDNTLIELGLAREKVRQNEAKVFGVLYEKENALRSLDFYHDVVARINNFEKAKEQHAEINTALATAGGLVQKIDALLAGDLLVRLFGNDGGAAARRQLEDFKTRLGTADQPVVDAVDELATSLDPMDVEQKALRDRFAAATSAPGDFATNLDSLITGLEGLNVPEPDSLYYRIGELKTLRDSYKTLAADRDTKITALEDERAKFETALTAFKTYAAANAANKGTPAYQVEVAKLIKAEAAYRGALADAELHMLSMQSARDTLDAAARGALGAAQKFIDGTRVHDARKTALAELANWKTNHNAAAVALKELLDGDAKVVESLSEKIETYSTHVSALAAALAERSKLYNDANDVLFSFSEGFAERIRAGKAELAFLLDETGSTTGMDALVDSLELEEKQKGAALNLAAAEHLVSLFPAGLTGADRDLNIILDNLRADIDARAQTFTLDANARRELEARRAVYAYLVGNAPAMAYALDDDDRYDDLVSSLMKANDTARELNDFYQAGGKYSDADRKRIKGSGTEVERMLLADSYRYGSNFLFASAVGRAGAPGANTVAATAAFAADVKAGRVLTVLADKQFRDQEAGGLLGQIRTSLTNAGIDITNLDADALYKDGDQDPAGLKVDATATAALKAKLGTLLAGATTDEQKLDRLLDTANAGVFSEIFGQTAGLVHGQLSDARNRLTAAKNETTKQRDGFIAGAGDLNAALTPFLAELADAKKTPYTGLESTYELVADLKTITDPAFPLYDTGGTYIGDDAPLKNLDLAALDTARAAYTTALADWSAKRDALKSAGDAFAAARTVFEAHRTANPGDTTSTTYNTLLADMRARGDALTKETKTYAEYRTGLEKAHADARTAMDAVLFEVGFTLPGLVGLKLLPRAAYDALTADEKTAVDGDPTYRVVKASDDELLRKLADITQGLNENIRGINTHSNDYNRAGITLISRSAATETTIVKWSAAETDLAKAKTDAAALTTGLDGRVVAYENAGGGKIAATQVIKYINGIRDFLFARDLSGEKTNQALREVLTQALAPADELDSLLYLQSHPAFADLKTGNAAAIAGRQAASDTELADAKKLREEREAAAAILVELRAVSKALNDDGRPLSADPARVTNLLIRYREFKNRPGMNYTVSTELDTAMSELQERAWQLHKVELVSAFLSNRSDERNPDVFLANLQAGKYYLYGAGTTRVEKKAGFLGEPLNAARIAELTTDLRRYNARTIIASGSVRDDLADFLDKQDPTLQAELGAYALEIAYDDIRSNLAAGRAMLSGIPAALKKYAGVEAFEAYLKGRDDLDATKAGDRVIARSAWLSSLYPDPAAADAVELAATLDEYLANYNTRNASFYLPAELKALHAAEKYYELDYTARLTPGDAAALNTWLANEKYEGVTQTEMAATVRMDYIMRNWYGENADAYQSEIDADLAGKTGTGLNAGELNGFLLQAAGISDPLGLYKLEPSLALQGDVYLNDFTYDRGLDNLAERLAAELAGFTRELNIARRDERRAKYLNDAIQGNLSLDTYRNYTGITTDGKLTKVSFEVSVRNRISEIEQQAEQKLAGLLKTLSYESYAYKTAPEFATYMSIEKTIAAFNGDYTATDTVTARAGGDFVFKADLDNLRVRLDSYVNAVQPDFGAANNPDANLQAAKGRESTLKKSIIEAGNLAAQYAAITGPGADLAASLETSRIALSGFETTFNNAKTEFDTAQAAVKTAQDAYNAKQGETTTAYTAVTAADRELAKIKAVYDFAQLWTYTGNGTAADTAREKLVEQAKTERDDAQKALDDLKKKIADIEQRVAEQATLAELRAAVQGEKDVMEKWALRAMRFSRAEHLIKERVRQLKKDIAAKKGEVEGLMDQLLPLPAAGGLYRDVDGYLDYGSSTYLASEERLRERYRMLNGIVDGKIGAYDLMFAQHPAFSQGGVPNFGQGLRNRHPDYDLHSYFRNQAGGVAPPLVKDAHDKLNAIWLLFEDPHNQGRVSGTVRQASDSYVQFRDAMNHEVGLTVAAQATIFAWMGIYGAVPAAAYVNAVNAFNGARDGLEAKTNELKDRGTELRNLYAELHRLTDISTVDQLQGVLGRKVGGNNEWGLTDADLALVEAKGCASNCALTTLNWKGEKKDLSFNEIAGSDGKSIAHLMAVHDSFGFYTRGGKRPAGSITAARSATDATGRGMSLMVSLDEFADAMAAMSRTQYEIGRSEYFAAAENFVNAGGVKVDARVLLEDRENFLHSLLVRAGNEGGTNQGIQYEMYRTIAKDYLGQGQAPDQVFELHLAQVRAAQLKEWENKERDYARRRQEWLTRIKNIRDQGLDQWDEIGKQLKGKWDAWTDEFDKQAKAKDAEYLKRIEDAVRKQQEWTANMLRSRDNGSEEQRIRELYESIDGMVAELRRGLPAEIALTINTNEILNKVRARKRDAGRELDVKMLKGALYADTNLFLKEAKALSFTSTASEGVRKSFDALQTELQERSQQLALIQILDELRMLPDTFEKTIAEANRALTSELDTRLTTAGFNKAGGGYARFVKTANAVLRGQPGELQILPGYQHFKYIRGVLPIIKDASGKSWNLENMANTDGSGSTVIDGSGIRAAELETMVRLAREQMQADFKKVYDPENKVNHELAVTAASGAQAISGVTAAATASAQSATAAGFSQGAGGFNPNAGFLVGPTEGGTFGKHHFDEFYKILKLKEFYDREKREADNPTIGTSQAMVRGARNMLRGVAVVAASAASGYAPGVAAGMRGIGSGAQAMSQAAGAMIAAEVLGKNEAQAADYLRRNPHAMEMGSMMTGTYAAYRGVKGYYEGGEKGAVTGLYGAAGKALSIFGVDADVNYIDNAYDGNQGFSGRLGFGWRFGDDVAGIGVGVSSVWTEDGGFGAMTASAGLNFGNFNFGLSVTEGGAFGLNAGVGIKGGGVGALSQGTLGFSSQNAPGQGETLGVNYSISGGRNSSYRSTSATFGLTYNANNGYGGSVGIAQGFNNDVFSNIGLNASGSLAFSEYGATGFGGNVSGRGSTYVKGMAADFQNVGNAINNFFTETIPGLMGHGFNAVSNALGFGPNGFWSRDGYGGNILGQAASLVGFDSRPSDQQLLNMHQVGQLDSSGVADAKTSEIGFNPIDVQVLKDQPYFKDAKGQVFKLGSSSSGATWQCVMQCVNAANGNESIKILEDGTVIQTITNADGQKRMRRFNAYGNDISFDVKGMATVINQFGDHTYTAAAAQALNEAARKQGFFTDSKGQIFTISDQRTVEGEFTVYECASNCVEGRPQSERFILQNDGTLLRRFEEPGANGEVVVQQFDARGNDITTWFNDRSDATVKNEAIINFEDNGRNRYTIVGGVRFRMEYLNRARGIGYGTHVTNYGRSPDRIQSTRESWGTNGRIWKNAAIAANQTGVHTIDVNNLNYGFLGGACRSHCRGEGMDINRILYTRHNGQAGAAVFRRTRVRTGPNTYQYNPAQRDAGGTRFINAFRALPGAARVAWDPWHLVGAGLDGPNILPQHPNYHVPPLPPGSTPQQINQYRAQYLLTVPPNLRRLLRQSRPHIHHLHLGARAE